MIIFPGIVLSDFLPTIVVYIINIYIPCVLATNGAKYCTQNICGDTILYSASHYDTLSLGLNKIITNGK